MLNFPVQSCLTSESVYFFTAYIILEYLSHSSDNDYDNKNNNKKKTDKDSVVLMLLQQICHYFLVLLYFELNKIKAVIMAYLSGEKKDTF